MKKFVTMLILINTLTFSQSIQLEYVIDYALKNNPQIKQYEARLNQKEYQNLEALGNFFPQINFNYSYTHLNDP